MDRDPIWKRSPLLGAFVGLLLAAVVAISCFTPGVCRRGSSGEDANAVFKQFNAGVAALEKYQYTEAFRLFSELAETAPDQAVIRFNKGLAALNLQKDHLAIAEKEFLRALELDPALQHARFSLGILYYHTQRPKEAASAFAEVVGADPSDPFALHWHGAMLADEAVDDRAKLGQAISVLESAVARQPALASSLYRLSSLYRRTGDAAKADKALQTFRDLNESGEALLAGIKYGESGKYLAAIRELPGMSAAAPHAAAPAAGKAVAGPFHAARRPDGSPAPPGIAIGDLDGDGLLDAVICGRGEGGAGAVEWFRGAADGSLSRRAAIPFAAVESALGDLDGDADQDLVLAGEEMIAIFLNDGSGAFTAGELRYPERLPGFPVRILILDADSDWDLDIAIACQVRKEAGVGGALILLNNNRDGSFTDVAERCGLADIGCAPADFLFGDIDGDIDQDFIAIESGSGKNRIFLNDRAWRYRAIEPAGEAASFSGADAYSLGASGIEGAVRLGLMPAPDGSPRWLSLDAGGSVVLESARLAKGAEGSAWIALELAGPKAPRKGSGGIWSNLTGIGARVELHAGDFLCVKQANGFGAGSARGPHRLYFELPRSARELDYARILWPDGVLQTETRLTAGTVHRIEEVERKPTSCPLLFAWDGQRFRYGGDFLGVGGLGYLEAPGIYGKPDPTELVEIPFLVPERGGRAGEADRYQLRFTEPLEECTYLDAVRLLVVDHPDAVSVQPHEMFAVAAPPPGFDLVAHRTAVAPVRAEDHLGNDVTRELREIDRIYAEHFSRDRRFPGVAEPHAVILDFEDRIGKVLAASERPVLLLYGYIEYGYSSSNFAAAQAGVRMQAPSFSVERGGRWLTLRENWGFPAGTPRWMAVDLSGLLRPDDRKIRVDTNLEIYWDRVLLAAAYDAAAAGDLRLTELEADRAELHLLGFPRDSFPDGRHPRIYDYGDLLPAAEVMNVAMKPFPGRYTRYGDVRELLRAADDRLAIFGPGDEVAVSFSAGALPPLPSGWKRSCFLKAWGWCKDTDLYTASPDSIEPLPYRIMENYPPPSPGAFEGSPGRVSWASEYNTRAVEPLRLGAPGR